MKRMNKVVVLTLASGIMQIDWMKSPDRIPSATAQKRMVFDESFH